MFSVPRFMSDEEIARIQNGISPKVHVRSEKIARTQNNIRPCYHVRSGNQTACPLKLDELSIRGIESIRKFKSTCYIICFSKVTL